MNPKAPKVCRWCGTPALGSRPQYCSTKCVRAAHNHRRKKAWTHMKLYRSRDGRVIHGERCTYAIPELRWHWATHQSLAHIAEVITTKGYRVCKLCTPLVGL